MSRPLAHLDTGITDRTGEVWKNIGGYEELYQVSNHGRVKSVNRIVIRSDKRKMTIKERILKAAPNTKGYMQVVLCNGSEKPHRVHRIVAKSFVENVENKPQINHEDGVKTNNYATNLKWCTNSENQTHAYLTGLRKASMGEKSGMSKLKEEQVLEIRKRYADGGVSQAQLGAEYGVYDTLISRIVRREVWTHI